MSSFFRLLLKRQIVFNSLKVSFVVGIVLNLVNQGSAIINGLEIAWGHVVMNFVVPYCVASYSAAKNEIERSQNNKQ